MSGKQGTLIVGMLALLAAAGGLVDWVSPRTPEPVPSPVAPTWSPARAAPALAPQSVSMDPKLSESGSPGSRNDATVFEPKIAPSVFPSSKPQPVSSDLLLQLAVPGDSSNVFQSECASCPKPKLLGSREVSLTPVAAENCPLQKAKAGSLCKRKSSGLCSDGSKCPLK